MLFQIFQAGRNGLLQAFFVLKVLKSGKLFYGDLFY